MVTLTEFAIQQKEEKSTQGNSKMIDMKKERKCVICGAAFRTRGLLRKTCWNKECVIANNKACQKAYRKSDKYQAYRKAYMDAYQKSDKFKVGQKAYRKSDKYKACQKEKAFRVLLPMLEKFPEKTQKALLLDGKCLDARLRELRK